MSINRRSYSFKNKFLLKDFLIITIGVIITAFGLVLFMIPYNIIAGGVSGLAIFNHFLVGG